MSHFSSYNTSDATSGNLVLAGSAVMPPMIMQLGVDAVIAGSVISDQSGTLVISQSFDGINYDFATTIAVVGGTGQSFNLEVIAPFAQIAYTNGGTTQTYFRLFARAFGNKSNG